MATGYQRPYGYPFAASGLGLASNENAYGAYRDPESQFYGRMPNRTVGGNMGLGLPNPNNVPSAYNQMHAGMGGPYQTMGPVAGNPGGRFYGGAQPGLLAYSGGVRPGFLGGASGSGGNYAGTFSNGVGRGYVRDAMGRLTPGSPGMGGAIPTGLLGMGGAASAGPGTPMAATPLGLAAGAPSARYQGYLDARDARRQNYYGIRQANQLAQRQNAMEARNPEYGMAMAALRMQQQQAQGLLGLRQQELEQRGDLARQGLEQRGLDRAQRMDLAKLGQQNALAMQAGAQAGAERLAGLQNAARMGELQAQQAGALGLAGLQTASAEKIAGLNTQTQRELGLAQMAPKNRELDIRERELQRQNADAYRAQAQAAYASGNIAEGRRLDSLAGGGQGVLGYANPGVAQIGAPGTTQGGAGIPFAARQAIDSIIAAANGNPQLIVNRLRQMGLTDEQINVELNTALPSQQSLGGGILGYGKYRRSTTAPEGAWFQQTDPNTGRVSPRGIGYLMPWMY